MNAPGRLTPLWEEHGSLNGKMIDYAGWSLPVQYAGSGISAEHLAVRRAAGLFDISHMGEIEIAGAGAAAFLNFLLPRDMRAAEPARACYSPLCQPDGGTVDDLIVYPLAPDRFLCVVNAANTDKDHQHILAVAAAWEQTGHARPQIIDRSAEFAQLALQGPAALSILKQIFPEAAQLRAYRFTQPGSREDLLLARTGYTGEDGFEISLPPAEAPALWRRLIALGAQPAGLGARDSLRLEAGMPLYGHELAPDITPLEAGLDRFVSLDKPSPGFVGQEALLAAPPRRRLIGLASLGRAIPRAGYPVILDGSVIGQVTSGGYSPSLEIGIALALVDRAADLTAAQPDVLIRERAEPFAVRPLPFVQRSPVLES